MYVCMYVCMYLTIYLDLYFCYLQVVSFRTLLHSVLSRNSFSWAGNMVFVDKSRVTIDVKDAEKAQGT